MKLSVSPRNQIMSIAKLSLMALVLLYGVLLTEGFLRVRVIVVVIGKRSLGGKVKLIMTLDPCSFSSYDVIYVDNKITKEEMEILFERANMAKTDPTNKKMDYYADEIFNALDTDGNKEVTPKEFRAKASKVIDGCSAKAN